MSIVSTATKKRMYELAEEILSEERQNREAEAKGYTRNSDSLCRLYDDADHEFRASRIKSLLDELNNVHQLADSYRQRIAELEARPLTVKLPPLNDDLNAILGRPNFTCCHLAELLRKSGEDIPRKAEREQAAVIYWFLGIYLEHGDKWESVAKADIQSRAAGITLVVGE